MANAAPRGETLYVRGGKNSASRTGASSRPRSAKVGRELGGSQLAEPRRGGWGAGQQGRRAARTRTQTGCARAASCKPAEMRTDSKPTDDPFNQGSAEAPCVRLVALQCFPAFGVLPCDAECVRSMLRQNIKYWRPRSPLHDCPFLAMSPVVFWQSSASALQPPKTPMQKLWRLLHP